MASVVFLFAGMVIELPETLEDSFQQLKEAQSKNDPALVKQFAGHTYDLARKVALSTAPEDADEKEEWAKRVAYAKEVELYTEYALYAAALQSTPAMTVDLLTTLEAQNPKSKYLDEAYGRYLLALNQTGKASSIPAAAERAIKNFPENEDLLLVLADNAMTRKQTDRALDYAERLISVLSRHAKPEGMSAADWERKRSSAVGRSRWIAGVMHSEKGQSYEADRDLRAALPLIKGSDVMTASAFFYLGVANYQLGAATRNRTQMLEAARFSEQAAAIKGPLADQAWRNAQAMKAEAAKMR
jgi:tetratricopeptide (TPR) repeat protein